MSEGITTRLLSTVPKVWGEKTKALSVVCHTSAVDFYLGRGL